MMDIEEKVLLLAIYKKEADESNNDVLLKMENTKVFSLKDGKRHLKLLKNLQYLKDGSLTLLGEQKAKEIELEFKL